MVDPEVYPLVDYHSMNRAAGHRDGDGDDDGVGHDGAAGTGGVGTGAVATGVGGNGQRHPQTTSADPDGDFVVIDHRSDDVQDHYLNAEDLVAAGLLGPEHDPLIGDQRPGGSPPRRRHRVRSTLLGAFGVVILLVVVGLTYVRHQVSPGGHPGSKVAVVVPPNSSSAKIGSLLATKGIIKDGGLFPYYVKIKGAASLLPGTYKLAKNESYGSVVASLEAGPPKVYVRLTVPEGYTLADIAQRIAGLSSLHLSAQKFLDAANHGTVRSPYEAPGSNNLEGLLFPATYDIATGMSEVDVLEKMVGAFNDEASQLGLAQDAAALHVTPYDVVKVASIVEREAKLDPDRGPVASSIYNRLAKAMTLGADSTLVYALRKADPKVNIATIDYNQANPFNTRLNKGLPPTPIANSGLPSLRAAAKPPSTNYLYFVEVSPNGQLGFASTNAGFQGLENQCKAVKLC
ncbi:MAG: endolytic transglycosylase MltG [Actinomycetota bacterium]|nr:endolytic transglycosylase MltG [Actinomycetota bacterium]MDQ6948011.1 endolytic transglycosylase MltG [Actinomycetota bacterium]